MIIQEIKLIDYSSKALKGFGLTVGTVLLIIGALLFYYGKDASLYFATAGIFLIMSGFLVPNILKPFNFVWMSLAVLLGFFMTRLILSVLFYVIMTPIGLVARLFGKDFIDKKINRNAKSYWNYRKKEAFSPEIYERQF